VVTEKLTMTNLHIVLMTTGMVNVTCLLVSDVFLIKKEVDLSVLTSQNAVH
jgi:hypothetical protein